VKKVRENICRIMKKRLVQREKTFGVAWENAKNDLKTGWWTHGKTLGAVWENAWCIME
jgi:hypothetical protein